MAETATETATPATQFDPEMVRQVTKQPLVTNHRDFHWVTEKVSGIVEMKTPLWWHLVFWPAFCLACCCIGGFTYLISTGVGVWGQNSPVMWAWDITNFVFWIGIGHAGTLISAILFLTRQRWRTSINRASEAMTLFAVICAGLYPGLHVGRVWMAWFLVPVGNSNAIWQNFRSPLLWDVFAVGTYFTVSVIFWYVGLIPDLATIRDRAINPVKKFLYGLFALGWRGGNRQWRNYEKAYLILAGISTPLVLSVHTIVSFDFATSIVPGWHTTIFPPYFVAGAIFGGFAMVLTLMLPARHMLGLHDLVTMRHVDVMAKIILLTGSIVGYAYIMEFFIAWYSQNPFEQWAFLHNRIASPLTHWFGNLFGIKFLQTDDAPFWWAYFFMMTFNVVSPQVFWFRWCRQNLWVVFAVCMCVNMGMWFERFVIIVTSIANDFLPGSWGMYSPTWVDIMTFSGSFGLFLSLFMLFCRFLPMIAMSEVKGVIPEADPHYHPEGHHVSADEPTVVMGEGIRQTTPTPSPGH
jgi:Ni/Fe-hydrogenase subunit HybB-like protein